MFINIKFYGNWMEIRNVDDAFWSIFLCEALKKERDRIRYQVIAVFNVFRRRCRLCRSCRYFVCLSISFSRYLFSYPFPSVHFYYLFLSLFLNPFNLFSAALFKSYSEYRAPAAILVTLKMHPSSHVNAPIRQRVVDLFHSRRLTFPRRSPISRKSREAHK